MTRQQAWMLEDGVELAVPGEVSAGRWPFCTGLTPHRALSVRHNCAEYHEKDAYGHGKGSIDEAVRTSPVQIEDSNRSQRRLGSRGQTSVSVDGVVDVHLYIHVLSTYRVDPPKGAIEELGLLKRAMNDHQDPEGEVVV